MPPLAKVDDRLQAVLVVRQLTFVDDQPGVDRCALPLAHLDRSEDMSRDQALRWAQLAPKWLGVSIDMRGKDEKVLGGKRGG